MILCGGLWITGSAFNNYGTLNMLADVNITGWQLYQPGNVTVAPAFNNSGVLFKKLDDATGAGGTGITSLSTPLNNTGQILVGVGALELQSGGTFSGSFSLGSDASLILQKLGTIFGGTYEFNAGSTIQGDGSVAVIDGATLKVNADLTLDNLELRSGAIDGTANLTIQKNLAWSGGRMTGLGTTTIASTGLLIISGDAEKAIQDRLLNNFGKVAWSTVSAILAGSNGSALSSYRNPVETAQGFTAAANTAATNLLGSVDAARTTLAEGEAAANQSYEAQEAVYANQYQQSYAAADAARQGALTQAYQIRAQSPADDWNAEFIYRNAVIAAEDLFTDQVTAAAAAYIDAERAIYQGSNPAYTSPDSYLGKLGDLNTAYQAALNQALAANRQALLAAAEPGAGNIIDLAHEIHQSIFDPGPGVSCQRDLQRLTAETRAALAIAYQREYGCSLKDDIEAHVSGPGILVSNTKQWTLNTLQFGQSENPATPQTPAWATQVASWANGLRSFVQNLSSVNIADVAVNAWNSSVTAVTDLAQQLRDNPLGVLRNVAQGIVDTGVVLTNAASFGLVPGLNDRAQTLIQNNSFYRAVNVASIVAREVALTVATGGGARLVLSGATRLISASSVGANILCRVTTASRVMQPYFAYQQVSSMATNVQAAQEAFARGDYETGARLLGQGIGSLPAMLGSLRETTRFARSLASLDPQRVSGYLAACFAAGTPIWGEFGSKAIEGFKVGEKVWARNENDPTGPLEIKTIEELFVSEAPIFHVHVSGQVIRTTAEHPFYVQGKGWTAAHALQIGDLLISHNAEPLSVEDVLDTREFETVYNFRVADHHTYYVGGPEAFGFTVWAHNADCTVVVRHRNGSRQVVTSNGERWNLPSNKNGSAIPNADPIGNQLQSAANQAAQQWATAGQANRWVNPLLSAAEQKAIQDALSGPANQRWMAALLERQARGRWVEEQVRQQAGALNLPLSWNRTGVDAINLNNPDIKYEILSGTASNLALHARRMADVAFRMITF